MEHPQSELVDTNNMSLRTDLFLDAMEFCSKYWPGPQMFTDRQVQAYLYARGVEAKRAANAYTVKYAVNPKCCSIDGLAGGVIYETVMGRQCWRLGTWEPEEKK
jgi:hypothetical protein